MSIFNKFRKANKGKLAKDADDSQKWKSVQAVPFRGSGNTTDNPNESVLEDPTNIEITPNLRQQDKIIKAIITNDIDIINQRQVEITPEERENFLRLVADSTITNEDFNNVVSQISAPYMKKSLDSIINDNIASDKHLSRILATTTSLGFDNYNGVSDDTLAEFIQRYPNPQDFEEVSNRFLQDIRLNNPLAKYQEYTKSMQDFKHIIYGKKQEYFDQTKILQKEAHSQYPQTSENQPPETSETLRPIESLLDSATFDNDAFIQNGQEYHLTTEHLKQANLAPRHELNIENLRVGFSDAFQVHGRDACLGYIQTPDGKVKVRSYYRSSSAGIWRYMPDYAAREDGTITWFGKGYGEESLTLPFEFQEKLNQISQQEPADLNDIPSEFLFAGTAHRYNSQEEYNKKLNSNNMIGDFYKEVSARPSYDFGHVWDPLNPPESVDITGPISPDFSHELSSSFANTRKYGNTQYQLFPSYDGNLRYTMGLTAQDGESRAWLCGIEVANSRLTSTGCRSRYASIGNVGTPLNEYRSQADGYGEEIGNANYVSMWQNYLSKMPFIQRYLHQTRK